MEGGNDASHGCQNINGFKISHPITQPLLDGTAINGGTQPCVPPELLQSSSGRAERSHGNTSPSGSTDGPNCHVPLTSIALLNIQGLKPRTIPTKVPFIQDLLVYNNLLFVALTETWLSDHLDAEVNVEGYKLFRQDRVKARLKRKGRDGGGTACYLKNDIAAGMDTIINFSNEVIDVLGLHVKVKNLALIIVYQQPDNRVGGNRSTHAHFEEGQLGRLRKPLNYI